MIPTPEQVSHLCRRWYVWFAVGDEPVATARGYVIPRTMRLTIVPEAGAEDEPL